MSTQPASLASRAERQSNTPASRIVSPPDSRPLSASPSTAPQRTQTYAPLMPAADFDDLVGRLQHRVAEPPPAPAARSRLNTPGLEVRTIELALGFEPNWPEPPP